MRIRPLSHHTPVHAPAAAFQTRRIGKACVQSIPFWLLSSFGPKSHGIPIPCEFGRVGKPRRARSRRPTGLAYLWQTRWPFFRTDSPTLFLCDDRDERVLTPRSPSRRPSCPHLMAQQLGPLLGAQRLITSSIDDRGERQRAWEFGDYAHRPIRPSAAAPRSEPPSNSV